MVPPHPGEDRRRQAARFVEARAGNRRFEPDLEHDHQTGKARSEPHNSGAVRYDQDGKHEEEGNEYLRCEHERNRQLIRRLCGTDHNGLPPSQTLHQHEPQRPNTDDSPGELQDHVEQRIPRGDLAEASKRQGYGWVYVPTADLTEG